jgi:hypothetical protein
MLAAELLFVAVFCLRFCFVKRNEIRNIKKKKQNLLPYFVTGKALCYVTGKI